MINIKAVTTFLIITVFLVLVTGNAWGAEKKTYALSKSVYLKLQRVQEYVEQNEVEDAHELLDKMLDGRLSSYERAQTWYTKGSIYYQSEQMDDALFAFKQTVIEPTKIAELLAQSTLRAVLQLSMSLNQLTEIDGYVDTLLLISTQPEVDQALAAQVYYKLENYSLAKNHIELAVQAYKANNITPKEGSLLLKNAILYEFNDASGMITTLNQLLEHYPKPKYMLFLASIYGQTGDTQKQTTLLESLYEIGELKSEGQYISLASLYIAEKVPFKGAVLIEQGIEKQIIDATQRNYELLSQAYLMAQEFDQAISALTKAAEKSESGELYLRLAYLLFDRFQYQQALTAVESALRKGYSTKNPIDDDSEPNQYGETHLLKAMLLFYLEQFDEAIVASQVASEYKSSRKHAEQWVSYIRAEQHKLAQLTGK